MSTLTQWAGRCIRSHHVSARCSACVEACPADALHITDGRVGLIAPACTGCGACVAACPSDALVLEGAKALPEIPADGRLTCRCARAAGGAGHAVGCVAAISDADFLVALTQGLRTLTLVTGGCEGCPSKPGTAPVARMKALAASFGRTLEVSVKTEAPSDVDGSRRHLLGIVARKATAPKPMDSKDDPAPIPKHAPFYLTPSRRRSVTALRTLVREAGEGCEVDGVLRTLFKAPRFDASRCTACGLCAAVCPNKALSARTKGEDFTVAAIEACCTGCGLCADICIAGAIGLDVPEHPDGFLQGKPAVKLKTTGVRPRSAWEGIVSGDFSRGFFYR